MPDSNTTQILINNSDVIFPYFLVVIVALVIILSLFRESMFKKYAKEYFNEEISKELKNYKKEFFSLLNDRKVANRFKEQSILILNDKESIIQDVAFMSNYVHQTVAAIESEVIDIHQYKLVALYIPKENSVAQFDSYVEKFLSKLDSKNSIVFIYHEGRIESSKLSDIPMHSSFVNSKLTLVEKLENAYLVKKIMEL